MTIETERFNQTNAIRHTISELFRTLDSLSDQRAKAIVGTELNKAMQSLESMAARIAHVENCANEFGHKCELNCNGGWRADVSFPMHYDHVSVEDARQCDQGAWPCADHACYSVL